MGREVELLKWFDALDRQASDEAVRTLDTVRSAAEYGEMLRKAMGRIDAEANRHFSLYLDEAKTNGYGFQAYLVEKKAIPQVKDAIERVEQEIQEYRQRVSKDVQELEGPLAMAGHGKRSRDPARTRLHLFVREQDSSCNAGIPDN